MTLTDDALFDIFTLLRVAEIARVERVSRQWHRVARSRPTLWRNAVRLCGRRRSSATALRTRAAFDAVVARSGGLLHRLELVISCSAGDYQHALYIANRLTSIKVERLRLDIDDKCHTVMPGHVDRQADAGRIFQTMMHALPYCNSLHTLRIETDAGGFRKGGQPLALTLHAGAKRGCKLQHFVLIGEGRLEDIAESVGMPHMLAMLERIKVIKVGSAPLGLDTWQMLRRMKDTIEVAEIGLGITSHHDVEGQMDDIVMPRLRQLRLMTSVQEFHPTPIVCPTLVAPALRSLFLEHDAAPQLVKGLFSETLEELRIDFEADGGREAVVLAMAGRCRELRSFTGTISGTTSRALLREHLRLHWPRLKDLSFFDPRGHQHAGSRLVSTIRNRQNNSDDGQTRFNTLHVYGDMMQKDLLPSLEPFAKDVDVVSRITRGIEVTWIEEDDTYAWVQREYQDTGMDEPEEFADWSGACVWHDHEPSP